MYFRGLGRPFCLRQSDQHEHATNLDLRALLNRRSCSLHFSRMNGNVTSGDESTLIICLENDICLETLEKGRYSLNSLRTGAGKKSS